MKLKKKFIWILIAALVVVAVVVLIVCLRKDKPAAPAAETAPAAEAAPTAETAPKVGATVKPAVEADWLELPGAVSGENYVVKTYSDSLVRNYTHLYDKETYTSLWTAYPLSARYMGSEPRPGKWLYSTSIDEVHQVNLRNRSYNDSYSRGHMIPNASRNGNKTMQTQTFFVTNSVPQIQNSFNSGIWSKLESVLQDLGCAEEIYIVTGVAFNKTGEDKPVAYTTAKDDTKQVPIPNYFYKVVLRVKTSDKGVTSASTIGFWMDHRKYDDSYTNYTVSVDQIEQWTGFDFFVNLPDPIESAAESNTSWPSFQNF